MLRSFSRFFKTIICLLFLTVCGFSYGQVLTFDQLMVDTEGKWIVIPQNDKGVSIYGFVYMDFSAGLTFDMAGSFTTDTAGKRIDEKAGPGFFKTRLQPSGLKVAIMPDDLRSELNLPVVPDWLKIYDSDDEVLKLYQRGYLRNAWNACEKALVFLEEASRRNPDYPKLAVELAFSYNCLNRYADAERVLQKALVQSPKDAYTNKEFVFTLAQSGQLDKAEKAYRKCLSGCDSSRYHAENAFNLLQGSFLKKDKVRFDRLFKMVRKELSADERYLQIVEQMEKELK